MIESRSVGRRWPLQAVLAAAILLAWPQLLAAAEEAAASDYVIDLAAVRELWSKEPPIEAAEDLFRVELVLGDERIVADTHLFREPLRIVPYHNADGVVDAAGLPIERGDGVLAGHFPPGSIGFAVKHRRPSHRRLLPGRGGLAVLKEELKLRDTHLEIVVGVVRDGRPGVITLNSPQTYEGGRFGSAGYPMIFVAPVLPGYLPADRQLAFVDNVRTMLLGFNAVLKFPLRYYGGDPLAAQTPASVREHVAMMVRAIAGDDEARRWFTDDLHLLYCGELAHLATSAGLLVPLNRRSIEPLVGEHLWREFRAQIEAHRIGKESRFTILNDNRFAALVAATTAPDDLEPLTAYAPEKLRPELEGRLAFQPMTATDMLESFLRLLLPRRELGESVAPLAADLLRRLEPLLLDLYGIGELAPVDPRRLAVERLAGEIREVVATRHRSYWHFRSELDPLLEELRRWNDPEPGSNEGWYLPPSLFHLAANGLWGGGLIELRYVAHGLHYSLLTEAAPAEKP